MKEKICFAPGLRGNEFIKTLALHGVSSLNLKIMGANELARYILMKANVNIQDTFITSTQECAVIEEAIKGEAYFGNTSYSDVQQISQAIRNIRNFVATPEEESVIQKNLLEGIFLRKNEAILKTYQKYKLLLEEKSFIDSVALVRKAIEEGEPIDAEFLCLEEFPLSPLEQALIEKASNGTVKTVHVIDLFGVKETEFKVESFKSCYGASNEVESILEEIYKGNKLDACTVVVTDAAMYSQMFFDAALLYDIPVTFGCGIPVCNSNPAKLLSAYKHWKIDGFYGKDSLMAMLENKAFNRQAWKEQFPTTEDGFSWKDFYDALGRLKLTDDAHINAMRIEDYKKAADSKEEKTVIPFLEVAARELSLDIEEFISKYTYVRKDELLLKLDIAAIHAIRDEIIIVKEADQERSMDEIINRALSLVVCKETSEAGKLHITCMTGAFSAVREYVYIAGLSASKFPGKPTENYLLLDSDIALFGNGVERYTSQGKIKRKKEQLMELVRLMSSMGSKVVVSYASMDLAELKADNASSMLFELYSEEHGNHVTVQEFENQIEEIEYFAPAISKTREVAKAYDCGMIIEREIKEEILSESEKPLLDRYWSPSAISTYIKDKDAFVRKYLLGIEEESNEDPLTVISGLDFGNIVHHLMEQLANSSLSKAEFLELAEAKFDAFIQMNPPVVKNRVAEEKKEFIKVVEYAYESDIRREVVAKEEEVKCQHSTGIKLRGYPDRVEKIDDKQCVIVDYKTGRKKEHEANDPKSCIQVLIYAYLMEQNGLKVSRGEYRYLRLQDTIPCVYDETMKDELDSALQEFKEFLETYVNLKTSDEE